MTIRTFLLAIKKLWPLHFQSHDTHTIYKNSDFIDQHIIKSNFPWQSNHNLFVLGTFLFFYNSLSNFPILQFFVFAATAHPNNIVDHVHVI